MALIPKSTAYTRLFYMVLSSDHITAATGKTCTVNISKAGAAFGAAAGTVTEISAGWYKVALTTADTGTAGDLAFDITASGCDPTDFCDQVGIDGSDSVRGGMTALPNASAGANTGLPVVGTQVPNATAGASGGLLISGSNSGTTTLGAFTVTGSLTVSDGLLVSRSTSNTSAITATGNGTGSGIVATSGSGATGDGIQATAASTNGNGMALAGVGTGAGLISTGGGTGPAAKLVGGGTSGDGLLVTTTSGHGFSITATGASKHGIIVTGGNSGTSDGLKLVAGTGGVGFRMDTLTASGAVTLSSTLTVSGTTSLQALTLTTLTASGAVAFQSTFAVTTSTSLGALSCTTITASGAVALQSTMTVTGATVLTGNVSMAAGLTITQSAANTAAVAITGNGSGAGLSITGGAAVTTTAAGPGLLITGGAASTGAGGVAGLGFSVVGGAGAASTNGAAIGAKFVGGGTNTVASAAHGLNVVGTSTGSGLSATSGGGATGDGITATAVSTNGNGMAHVSTGTGSGILTDKLTASGAVAFQSTFAVTTSTNLGALSATTVTFSGAVAFQSTFAVTTSTSLGALSCTTLTASGAVAFQSTFAVTTSTSLAALSATTITASGTTSLAAVTTSGTVTLNALTVSNATTLTGAVSLGSTLGVTGTTTFAAINTGAIGTGNFTITGTLSTSGTATFNAFTVTNALTISGATTLTGAVTAINVSNDIRGITVSTIGNNVITAASIADGAIDRATFAVDTGLQTSRSGTAQAGGANSLTLDAGASAVNQFYVTMQLYLTGGTGAGQVQPIVSYSGGTKVATCLNAWATQPDNTTTFAILPIGVVYTDVGYNAQFTTLLGDYANNTLNASVASVAGSVDGDVTGKVLGTGSGGGTISGDGVRAASVTGTVGGMTPAGWATAFTVDTTKVFADAVSGSVVKEIATGSGSSGLTAAQVWAYATRILTAATNITSDGATISQTQLAHLNADISSRMATFTLPTNFSALAITPGGAVTVGTNNDKTGYTLTVTPPTAAQIATTIFTDLLAGSDFSIVGSFGKLIKDDIDATISSRGTGTALTANQVENAVLDGLTANHSVAGSFGLLIKTDLDATVSSRLATASYTSPPSAATISTQVATDLATAHGAGSWATATGFAVAGDAMTLTVGERNAVADAFLDRTNAIETGMTPRGAFRVCSAALAGVLTGSGTATVTIKNALVGDKDRIVATIDGSNDRTALVLDLT